MSRKSLLSIMSIIVNVVTASLLTVLSVIIGLFIDADKIVGGGTNLAHLFGFVFQLVIPICIWLLALKSIRKKAN